MKFSLDRIIIKTGHKIGIIASLIGVCAKIVVGFQITSFSEFGN